MVTFARDIICHMEQPPKFEKSLSISEAITRIQAIMQQEMLKGAVDSEPEQFSRIIQEIESGDITPEEGVARAQGVADSRQDYH